MTLRPPDWPGQGEAADAGGFVVAVVAVDGIVGVTDGEVVGTVVVKGVVVFG